MSRIIVVGSGPSGVHFAETVLGQGHEVLMLDVGHQRPAPVLPDAVSARAVENLLRTLKNLRQEIFPDLKTLEIRSK